MSKVIGVTVGTNYDKSKLPSGGLTDDQAEALNNLKAWYDKENYEKMTASLSPTSTTYEIGTEKNLTFTWKFTKEVSSVTFNGQDVTKATSYTVNGVKSTTTFKVVGTRKDGEKETAEASTMISFHNKYFMGCAAKPAIIDSGFIKGLTPYVGWASSRQKFTKTIDCPSGKYIWYAYPARLGGSMFKVGGFQGGFEPVQTVSFTNDSGHTENYYVYRSTNAGLGTAEVQVL